MRNNFHHNFGEGNEYGNIWYIYNIDNSKVIDCFDGHSNDCWEYIEEIYSIGNVGKIACGNAAEANHLGIAVHY